MLIVGVDQDWSAIGILPMVASTRIVQRAPLIQSSALVPALEAWVTVYNEALLGVTDVELFVSFIITGSCLVDGAGNKLCIIYLLFNKEQL